MCLARFDDDTREGFMSLYAKVDDEIENGVNPEDETASPQGNACPF